MANILTHTLRALALTALVLPVYAGPKVLLETSQGNITIELDQERAPNTVENFLRYVDAGFYAHTVFHRVIANFMIQGGGMDSSLVEKPARAPIMNEANNGLKNVPYSIAMARTSDPHSASAQFFINVKDNNFLDYPGHDGWGYAVFGKVIEGQATVDRIANLPTGPQDVPVELPVITRASRILETTK